MSEETYYIVLGVAETATPDEIKRAYRSLLKKIHPDTVSTLSEDTRRGAEEATREINEAYSVLSDPGQRAEYDYHLAEKRQAGAAGPDTPSPQSAATNSQDASGISSGDASRSQKGRRRRRRRRHHRRHSSKRESIKSLFRPVSVADWLVLFCYIFVAIGILAFLAVIISSASNSGSEDISMLSVNGKNAMFT